MKPVVAKRAARRHARLCKIERFKQERYADLKWDRVYLKEMEEHPYSWEDAAYIARWKRRHLYKAQREVDNPAMCSSHCCGNPRHHGYYKDGRTFQERNNALKFKESIKDWQNPDDLDIYDPDWDEEYDLFWPLWDDEEW